MQNLIYTKDFSLYIIKINELIFRLSARHMIGFRFLKINNVERFFFRKIIINIINFTM